MRAKILPMVWIYEGAKQVNELVTENPRVPGSIPGLAIRVENT